MYPRRAVSDGDCIPNPNIAFTCIRYQCRATCVCEGAPDPALQPGWQAPKLPNRVCSSSSTRTLTSIIRKLWFDASLCFFRMTGEAVGPPAQLAYTLHSQSAITRTIGRAAIGDTLVEFGMDESGSTTFMDGQRIGALSPGGSSGEALGKCTTNSGVSEAALSRHGTLLSTGAPSGRNAAELNCLLGDSSAKLRAGALLLPQPGLGEVTRHDLTALEQAKPRARVEVDIILESDTCVEGTALAGRILVNIRNRLSKESAIMIGGGKLRLIGFESISNEHTRHMFYQCGSPISVISKGSDAMYGSKLDQEGFGLAREGNYILPFSLPVPLDGEFGKPKGPYTNSGVAVRYIAMISLKVKDICTSKRSITHFYRYCVVWPRLNPSAVLAPSPKPIRSSVSKGLFMGGNGKVELTASLHRPSWVAGQQCCVRISIVNYTNKRIKRISISLVRSVIVFVPQPELDASSRRSGDIDPDSCQTSTSRKQVAESILEMGTFGNKGRASAKGWWTGVAPNERYAFTHTILLPSDALTLKRSRLLEVKYELCVTASAGPLSSNPEVMLPIDIVNFFSLDPPPSSAFSLVTETSNESCHGPPATHIGVQSDRPVASNIFVSDETYGSDIHSDDPPLGNLTYDPADSREQQEQRSLRNRDHDDSSDDLEQTDEDDGHELGNLALRDDCDDFVQHAINSAKIDSMYGENALRFSDLYVQNTQESLDALKEIEEGSERDDDQFEEHILAPGSPINEVFDATRPSTPVREDHSSHSGLPSHQVATGSLRYGPRPNRRSRPSFAIRVQEKMKAAGFHQAHSSGSEAEQLDFDDFDGAHQPDMDKTHDFAISDLNSEPPTHDHLIPSTHVSSQVRAQLPSSGSRMLPQLPDSSGPTAPSMIRDDVTTASKTQTRSETPSSVQTPPADGACVDKQQPIRPAGSLGETESPVKRRIREMEERLKAQT
ncbi:Arrestin C-terminal-like domain-containing protein [Pleurotus pulmonarius]